MEDKAAPAVGIPWYSRDDYARIKVAMEDGDRLPATFDTWLAAAERVVRELESDGQLVVKAHLYAEKFVVWCAMRDLPVDAKARMQFAADYARRHVT